MTEQIDTPLIEWMRAHRQTTRFIMFTVGTAILLVGGYLLIRDLNKAIVEHSKPQLVKIGLLFVGATFWAIRRRAGYVKIVEDRDRKSIQKHQ